MWNKIKGLFKKTWFNVIVIFLLTGLVFWYTMKDNYSEIIDMFKHANLLIVFGIVLLCVLERWLLGWGLMTECRQSHPKYKWSQGFVNAYVAGFFNNVTPSASGGQFFQMLIFRKQGIPFSNSVGVLWLDFIVYQTTMSIYVLVLLLLRFDYYYSNYSQFFLIVIFGFLVSSAIIGFLWLLAMSKRFYTWLTTKGILIGAKLHLVKDKEKTLANLDKQLEVFSKEIVVLKTHRKMIIMLAIENAVRLTIYWSIPFLCAKALNVPVGLDRWLDMLALASFVAMVNAFLPMPGSSGGTEATFVLMFSTILGKVDATSVMVLWRVMTFYLTLLFGGIIYAYANSRETIVYNEDEILLKNEENRNALEDFKKEQKEGNSL